VTGADGGADSDTDDVDVDGADVDGADHPDGADVGDTTDADGAGVDGPTSRAERRELALDLLAHLEVDELPLSAVVDRVETVTTDPSLVRDILDTAELRGIIDRDGGRVRTRRGGTFVRFESQVVTREGEFECRRCGAGISTGHFVRFEAGELGPFGSSCVRKVTGRE